MDTAELAKELSAKAAEFKHQRDELKQMGSELTAKLEKGERVTDELKGMVDKTMSTVNGLQAGITEIEQKLANVGKQRESAEEKSWGQQFVEGASYKGASDRSSRRTIMAAEVKAVTTTTAGGNIRSLRESGILELPRERQTIRSLIPVVPINTGSVDYTRQTLRTNSAAPVAEQAAKPYSDYAWDSVTVATRTLAHLAKITRQALDDAPRLAGEIDSEMRYGLSYVEERQFLYGNNTGQQLHGIMPQASNFARPVGVGQMTGATNIDVLRVAALQASLALFPADGIILNELDWAVIELTKETTGAYLLANPQGGIAPRMWNLPVVPVQAMTTGDFCVGSFRTGAVIYDRMGVEVLISTENADDFEKNMATMRAEERVAIAVKRPGSFIKGTFATARTALAAV